MVLPGSLAWSRALKDPNRAQLALMNPGHRDQLARRSDDASQAVWPLRWEESAVHHPAGPLRLDRDLGERERLGEGEHPGPERGRAWFGLRLVLGEIERGGRLVHA